MAPWLVGSGGRAERSGARRALGATKEVLGSIDFPAFKDFLGSSNFLLGFIIDLLGSLLGFYQDFDSILIRFDSTRVLLGF